MSKGILSTSLAILSFLSLALSTQAQVGSSWTQKTFSERYEYESNDVFITKSPPPQHFTDGNSLYDNTGGVETFQLLNHHSNRAEIRPNDDYSTGSRQFQADVLITAPTHAESIHQIFNGPTGPWLIIREQTNSNGSIRMGGGTSSGTLASNLYGNWFRLNTINDMNNGQTYVYVNGKLVWQSANPGGTFYTKYGAYGTHDDAHDATIQFKNAKLFNGGNSTKQDFTLTASPSSQSVVGGDSASYTVTTAFTNTVNNVVYLSISGLPSGASASFSPSSVTGSGSSTLTVNTSGSTPGGTYTLTITGATTNSSYITHTKTVTLSVQDFSVGVTPASQTIVSGGSGSYTATVSAGSGFGGTVTWSASGLPSGATASFSPASITGVGSSTMTLNLANNTPSGTYTFTVTGTSGSTSHSATATVIVSDFTISATPSSQTIPVGSATTYTVNLGSANGFSSAVNLSISGLPAGATASFSPASPAAPGSSTLTITTSGSTPIGTSALTITGTSGSLTHSTTVSLSVTAPPDFTIAATPSSQTIAAGSGTTYTTTIGALNGFNGAVNLSMSGLPTGATASFNPASVTGSGSSTVTVTTTASTPVGSYTLTISGTSGSLTHSTTVSLNVTAPPDFTISATPSSQTIPAGSGTTYTATIGALNGFNGAVNFSVSGLPSGATVSFNPASVTGSGSSTVTVTTTASTPVGSYTLTITGTSGSLTHSTTVSLNVTVSPDFTIAASPSSQTVTAGSGTSYTATIGALNGFGGAVNFTVSGLPSGATASFNPASITSSGSSTLTVTTSASTPAGTSTLTITGTSGSLSHSTTVTLVVNAATLTWTTVNDTSTGITFSGTWNYSTNRNDGDINNDVHYAKTNGYFAQFTFTGTGVQYITETFSDEGNVDVYIDGVFQATVSCNSASRQSQFVAYSNTSLSNGSHTIKVVKNGGTYMLLDGFAYATGGSTSIALTDTDIGAVGIAGSASFNNGVYTVSGSGSDIWTTGDQFNYDYRNATNDVTVLARVVSETGTQTYAKAGAMIRETLATNSIEASVLLTPTNGVAMEIRGTSGSATVNMTGWVKPVTPPTWVKITRSGSTFTGFYSADGATWTQLATTNVTMAASAKVGLAVTAHSNAESNTATFDNVAIQ